MSLAQRLALELDDGRRVETTYDLRDLRAWEAHAHKSALNERMTLDQLTWLGHHAAVRQGDLDGELKDFKAFGEVCVSVEGVRDQAPPDPTPTSPSDDSSAP